MIINVPKDITIKELFLGFIPKTFTEISKDMDLSDYKGIEATTVIELSGEDESAFTFELKNGSELTVTEEKKEGAIAYFEIDSSLIKRYFAGNLPVQIMERVDENLENPSNIIGFITNMPPEEAKKKLEKIKSVDGKAGFKAIIDGETFETYVRINGADSPGFNLIAKFDDILELLRGELNPIQGFMGGKFKIEGDIGLAMKMQSLIA